MNTGEALPAGNASPIPEIFLLSWKANHSIRCKSFPRSPSFPFSPETMSTAGFNSSANDPEATAPGRQPGSLDFKLPPLVEGVQQGWAGSCQASAVVAALFAAIEAQLIVLIKTPPDPNSALRNSNAGLFRFLLLLSYSGLAFNSAATVTSLIISDQLGEMPFRARKVKKGPVPDSAHALLKTYKVSKRWSWLIGYWYLLLFCGGGCVFMQVGVYVWLHEADSVRTAMAPVLVLCAASLLIPLLL